MPKVAITQMALGWDVDANLDQAEAMVRKAAKEGAEIILLQELFATVYFCPEQHPKYFDYAHPVEGHPFLGRFADLAKELGVVLPISFFEQATNAYFNSVMMIDADGRQQGVYRKTHIPQGPGYEEKFYFSPGDLGFKVWDTAFGRIGVGICWDQWFPETARSMALMGADLLLYPTAIGSEPGNPGYDSSRHWQRAMQGHAAANMVGLAASNRVGQEEVNGITMDWYGQSFIADATGDIVAGCGDGIGAVAIASFDFEKMRRERAAWGLFRDRRPDRYEGLISLS
ncbi:MAG: N-carbamoylputrescine amidase [Alphaproteobacteria bacterium]|nr:N-carbamoylputrescine amidase [Alphaproteobacteria bacterium]